ncbi:MAG: type IV toxin-antitoxin system AbiEi family antitoxin domain-containing protein [Chloroflexi bacterium]|nr:type IV toxin-antitoxin system AbiEi family antitoxin domain-containing protein [Chloroflexota bacterium]
MKKSIEKSLKIFSTHNGILRTSQAIALGIAPRVLYELLDKGLIRRLSRGVYQLSSQEHSSNPDFIRVVIRIPQAVICLISALYFYKLSTQIPHKVYIALPQSAEKPRIEFPPLDIIWPSDKVYSAGITEQQINGFSVKIYCREKTIADCFKFRNKVGMETALDALRDYLKSPECNLNALLIYARINRVEKIISPYLEALI